MNTVVIFVLSLLLAVLGYAYWALQNDYNMLHEQLQTTTNYQQHLQDQLDYSARERMVLEAQLGGLESRMLTADGKLSGLSADVASARQRIGAAAAPVGSSTETVSSRTVSPASLALFSSETLSRSLAEGAGLAYDDFLDQLELHGSHRVRIRDALIDARARQYAALPDLMAGALASQEAAAIFGPKTRSATLKELLSEEQLRRLDEFNSRLRHEALSLLYNDKLTAAGPALGSPAAETVLRTLLAELSSAANNHGSLLGADGSVLHAVADRNLAFDRARNALEDDLNHTQLGRLDRFIAGEKAAWDVILDLVPGEQGQMSLRNMRVPVADLPL